MYAQPQSQPPRPLPVRARSRNGAAKKSSTPWLVVAGAIGAGLILLLAMVGVLGVAFLSPGRIPAGVRVGGVLVGNKTAADATRVLQSLVNQTITLTDEDRSWSVPLSQLGIQVDVLASLGAAQTAAVGASIPPRYDVDLSQTQNTLISLSDQINVPATSDQLGRAVDIPFVLNRLHNDLTGEISDGVLDLNMIEVQPPVEMASADSSGDSNYTGPTTTHIVEHGQELGLIAKMYNVSMDDIVNMNGIANPDLLYEGEELTIPAAGVYQPTAANSPPAPLSAGKSIVVSTEDQRIYAYQDGQLIRSDLVSTGLPGSPTVKGDFNIYVKYQADDMSGPDYFLPQVPYVMYFYQGYGIHGTYWHNAFGRPMSHGCVNLPTDEAQWFFNWAEVGTLVRVI
jgi:lipoprotein-anchoring transpeptidase ErfK/SrfK